MKDNKIIAEFMGVNIITIDDIRTNKNPYISSADGYTEEDLQYHTSWDWLMPVLKKINGQISPNVCGLWRTITNPYEFSIEEVYKQVVEFIKDRG